MQRPFQAYGGTEPFVFVCYAHEDSALVYPEIERLNAAGFNVWYDEGISPGSEWTEMLADKIKDCAVFVYFVTPNSVRSQHCRSEVGFALEEQRAILAVHLVPTDVPPGLRLSLNIRQAILTYEQPPAISEAKLDQAIRDAQSGNFDESRNLSVLQLGDWILDAGSQRLVQGDQRRTLDPKALSVLLHLVDRAPEAVSRNDLLAQTWPDVFVGDNVLDQVIADLRRALGDQGRIPRYIDTLPKRGYRLLVPVGVPVAHQSAPRVSSEGASRNWRRVMFGGAAALLAAALAYLVVQLDIALPAGGPPANSVAVLQFEDLTPTHTEQWLGSSIVSELRVSLPQRGLLVVGRADYRQTEVTRTAADARYMVGGSVRRFRDTIRVTAELISTETEYVLWSSVFEQVVQDDASAQAQIAADIVDSVARHVFDGGAPALLTHRGDSRAGGALDGLLGDAAETFPALDDAQFPTLIEETDDE